MIKILYFASDDAHGYNSSHFRVSIHADALESAGLAETRIIDSRQWMNRSLVAKEVCEWADIIVIQRVMTEDSWKHAVEWMKSGTPVVVDFDDAYDLIGEENAAWSFWGEGVVDVVTQNGYKFKKRLDTHPVDQLRAGLGKLAGAVVPSRQLADDWRQYIDTFVLPNYLDVARYNRANMRAKSRLVQTDEVPIIIGWGGSMSHLTSFAKSGVQEALGVLLSEYNGRVLLKIVGDKRVVDQLPFEKRRVTYSPYVTFHHWPLVLNTFDIGIAPLAGEYDARRSDLKVKEYLAMKIPFVATYGAPYKMIAEKLPSCFVNQGDPSQLNEANPEDWYNKLKWKIESRHKAMEEAANAQQDLLPIYSIDHNIDNVHDAYLGIIESYKKKRGNGATKRN